MCQDARMTSDPSENIFASSIRIKSAPVSAKQRTKPKMNGVFELPSSRSTSRSTNRTNRGQPKPAWAQPSGPKKSEKTPVKSSRLARPKTPEHERTRIISKVTKFKSLFSTKIRLHRMDHAQLRAHRLRLSACQFRIAFTSNNPR